MALKDKRTMSKSRKDSLSQGDRSNFDPEYTNDIIVDKAKK